MVFSGTLFLALLLGLALDRLWGEPRRWHPLVGLGKLAQLVEQRLNSSAAKDGLRRLLGVAALLLLLLPRPNISIS